MSEQTNMIGLMTDKVVWRATELAVRCHDGQRRKGAGSAPYITHPMRVALYLAQAGMGPEVVAAGLLHDVLEETGPLFRPGLREELLSKVGLQVTKLVEAVSDADPEASWHERKDAYLHSLESAPKESLAVSCADKLDNTLGLIEVLQQEGEAGLARFNSPLEAKIAYHEAVAQITKDRWPDCPLVPPLRIALMSLRFKYDLMQKGHGRKGIAGFKAVFEKVRAGRKRLSINLADDF